MLGQDHIAPYFFPKSLMNNPVDSITHFGTISTGTEQQIITSASLTTYVIFKSVLFTDSLSEKDKQTDPGTAALHISALRRAKYNIIRMNDKCCFYWSVLLSIYLPL